MKSRSTAYVHSRQRLLHSNLCTLLGLTVLFLHLSWLYDGLKHVARQQQHRAHQLHDANLESSTSNTDHLSTFQLWDAAAGTLRASSSADHQAEATGHMAGQQLTSPVTGSLFSWGLDDAYRLGRTAGDSSVPQLTLPNIHVVSVAASRHSLLATVEGTVFSMGPNNSAGGGGYGSKPLDASGQLGRPGSAAPAAVHINGSTESLAGHSKAVQVASGRYHSVAVTSDGDVYTWGLNDWGQLGRQVRTTQGIGVFNAGDINEQDQAHMLQPGNKSSNSSSMASSLSCSHGWSCHAVQPGRVSLPAGTRVVAAAAGRYSTLVLDAAGQIWTWGYDGCAQGQLPRQQEAWQPRRVGGQLQGKRVVALDVGYTFWLAATADGELYTCDNMDDGYAGSLPEKRRPNHSGQLGRSAEPHLPGKVDALSSEKVVAVAAGREHAVVATSKGQVFTFGGATTVLGRQGPQHLPGLVEGALVGQVVRHVAAGEYYSLAATDSKVFSWGSNAYACLGNGNKSLPELLTPAAVSGPLGSGSWRIHGLAAGYQHAFAVATPSHPAEIASLTSAQQASLGVDVTGVEVILTDEQKLKQQQYQQQQQLSSMPALQQLGTPVEHEGSSRTSGTTSQHIVTAVDAPDANRNSSYPTSLAATLLHNAINGNITGISGTPSDWHTSYLPRQFANLPLPRDVWAAWTPSPLRQQLELLSGDVFKLLPQEYNSMHKNPCWGGTGEATAKGVARCVHLLHKDPCCGTGPELSCLPYFNIIGVSKCGTTDLYHRLTMHKQVLPATNKGPHFWDECPYPVTGACTAGPSGDFQAYINLFSRAADLIRSRPDAITGEASSNTFSSANGVYLRGFKGNQAWSNWAGDAGMNASMPALLREAQPYLRLIVLLRDPVDRYYSAYNYYRWWKSNEPEPTPNDFHSVAVKEVQQWQACVAAIGKAECIRRYKPQQLVKGMYAEFIQDWLHHFPREQLLILRHEDYTAALQEHLKAVLKFLDIQEADGATLAAMSNAAVENNKAYPPMRAGTRALLQKFYEPFNQRLCNALDGDNRWLWSAEHS